MDRRFSKREQEIVDIIYRLKKASVNDVIEHMENPPGYSAVRALMRIMEEKGILKHHTSGSKYIYELKISRTLIRKGALRKLIEIYFENSVEEAVSAILQESDTKLKVDEIKAIEKLVNDARTKIKE